MTNDQVPNDQQGILKLVIRSLDIGHSSCRQVIRTCIAAGYTFEASFECLSLSKFTSNNGLTD
jgi:hypothetical protein